MLEWLLVFVGVFFADVAWVLCVRTVQNTQPVPAGLWAVGIALPTSLVTTGYVKDLWLLVPLCLGHFLGTYCTTKWEARVRKKIKSRKSNDNEYYDRETLAYWEAMEKPNATQPK